MKFPRRQFLQLAAIAASLPAMTRIAGAQAYPTRPVRLVVPFPPGGPNDLLARLMGQWLSERLEQPFVIDNRPGAGGNIGTETVVRSLPDGYTLLLISSNNAISGTLYDKLSFNFIRDISAVATIARLPQIMLINPTVPTKTVPEFIAYAKTNPGKLSFASVGNGSTPHISGELFKIMTGIDMLHVPYRGGAAAITDLISGQVQVAFIGPAAAADQISTGKLRALAVTTTTRLDA
jgi:tripartite-type tricarboxylate transporter receptor subunit TctC